MSNATQAVVWKLHYEPGRDLHLSESWRKLSCANVKAFDEAVELVKSSTELRSFEPKSFRVACYASSWCTYQKRKNDRRRSGNIFTGSIIKALVNRSDGLKGDGDQFREFEIPRSKLNFHLVAFHVSFWFFGLFDDIPFPLRVSGRALEERISLSCALVLPCIYRVHSSSSRSSRREPCFFGVYSSAM
jgi:hypothetical protein